MTANIKFRKLSIIKKFQKQLFLKNLTYFPFIKYNILKKFYKKKRFKFKKLKLYKLSIKVFKFFEMSMIDLYNGKRFVKFNFQKLKIFLVIGEFVTTRIMNFGKVLHKRKNKKK